MKLKLFQYSFALLLVFFAYKEANCQHLRLSNPTTVYPHLAFENNVGDSIVKFDGYAVIYSFRHRLPLYTFHKLSKDQIVIKGNSALAPRSSSFRRWLFTNTSSAGKADYKKSGYDRGHMVPAGDFVWNSRLKDETFWYINVNPQSPNLNQGIWAHLENEIRQLVILSGTPIFVITGVVFSPIPNERIGPNSIEVPVSFFKIIYSPENATMAAFLFDNKIDVYNGHLRDFQVTVDFIESITGEDFFDLLDDQLQTNLESSIIPFDNIKK